MHESHRCAICAAEFASSRDLVRHEQMEHTHQAHNGNDTGHEVALERGSAKPRAGRSFTRRNLE